MKYLLLFFACFLAGMIIHSCGGSQTTESSDLFETGLVIPENWEESAVFESPKIPTSMPDNFEYKNLPPIKNQRACGSCVAFATAGVLEFLEYGITGEYKDLAEQTLVSSCSNSLSCSGGWFGSFDYTTKFGLPLEMDDPYLARNSRCKGGLKPAVRTSRYAYVGARGREPTTEEIKAAIMTYGIVASSVAAGGSFKSYRGGTYTACNANRTDHAINLVGWKTENGQTVWRLKNSWSQNWGQQGYMDIIAEKNGRKCNAVGQTVVFATYNYDKL